MTRIGKTIIVRLLLGLMTLLFVSLLIFGASELLPGDFANAILGQASTPEAVAAIKRELGLDLPTHERYFKWLWGVLHGDFGTSLADSNREVTDLLSIRLGNTFFLASYAAAIAIPVALTLGVLTALFRNSWFDKLANTLTLTSISIPEYLVAYILILWLAQSGLFPSMARIPPDAQLGEKLHRAFLPALTLTLVVVAHMMRMTRAAIINVLASPFIEMARLKGMKPLRVILYHAVPNAFSPIINVVALNVAYLISGVVIVEVVFVFPGLGQLLVDSVANRDLPVVQAVALIFAAVYILLNLFADILSTLSNPRLVHRS